MVETFALVIRRLLAGAVTIFLVATFVFFFIRAAGDPVSLIGGAELTEEELQIALAHHGLDQPLAVQYRTFLSGAIRGDFGTSLKYSQPAFGLVIERMPATLQLTFGAVLLAAVVAIPVGIVSAVRPGSLVDSLSRLIAVLGQSIPSFWLGMILILIFAVRLGLLPATGSDGIKSFLLPVSALAVYSVPLTMRITRASVMETLGQDYIAMARAKGLSEAKVVWKHALRNAGIPVITMLGLRVGTLITGSVVLEEVFAYPGVGRLAIDSMRVLDFPVVQAFIVVVAATVILVNLVTDIIYGLIDPRIGAA